MKKELIILVVIFSYACEVLSQSEVDSFFNEIGKVLFKELPDVYGSERMDKLVMLGDTLKVKVDQLKWLGKELRIGDLDEKIKNQISLNSGTLKYKIVIQCEKDVMIGQVVEVMDVLVKNRIEAELY